MIEVLLIILLLSIGSFGNNVISYLSGSAEFDLFRSNCMCGEKKLRLNEIIPVISYLYLGGKCSRCQKKISIRYPIVEILTLGIGLLFYAQYGQSLYFLFNFLFSFFLLLIAFIDFKSLVIPNILVLCLLGTATFNMVFGATDVYSFIYSCIVVSFFILVEYIGSKKLNKNVIGFGDIKLLGALFLFFQLPVALFGLWLSSLIALIGFLTLKALGKTFEEGRIPFGFFLGLTFVALAIFNDSILQVIRELTAYL